METYLFVGSKNIINYYFVPSLLENNKIIVYSQMIQPILKSYIKKDVNIKNKNYICYEDVFFEKRQLFSILKKYNPDYIIFDINTNKINLYGKDYYEKISNLFEIVNDYNSHANVILISSCDIYDSINLNEINENCKLKINNKYKWFNKIMEVEQSLDKYSFNKVILRVPNILGKYAENEFIEQKISQIFKGKVYLKDCSFYNFINYEFLNKVLQKTYEYLNIHNHVNEKINVVGQKIDRDEFVWMLIRLTGYSDLYHKHPDSIEEEKNIERKLSGKKLKQLFNLEFNFNVEQDLKETIDWYCNSHLMNQRLTKKIKKEILMLKEKKMMAYYNFISKYSDNALMNLEIIKYFHKFMSTHLNITERQTFDALTYNQCITNIKGLKAYLKTFYRKTKHINILGIKFQKNTDGDILDEYDRLYYKTQIKYLQKVKKQKRSKKEDAPNNNNKIYYRVNIKY